MRDVSLAEIKNNFIEFLEADVDVCEYEIPEEIKYSEIEDFNARSTEKWATEELLDRIRKGDDAEKVIWNFCGDMLYYMRIAKTQDAKEHFHTAYYVGQWLVEVFDDIAYAEEE